jgi:hypothetical protein
MAAYSPVDEFIDQGLYEFGYCNTEVSLPVVRSSIFEQVIMLLN